MPIRVDYSIGEPLCCKPRYQLDDVDECIKPALMQARSSWLTASVTLIRTQLMRLFERQARQSTVKLMNGEDVRQYLGPQEMNLKM